MRFSSKLDILSSFRLKFEMKGCKLYLQTKFGFHTIKIVSVGILKGSISHKNDDDLIETK